MKNKFRIVAVLAMITLVAAVFSGCFIAQFGVIKSIALVGTPKTVYTQNETFDAEGFKIKVTYTSEKQEEETVGYNNDKVEFVNNFDSSKLGSYTCIISVKGNDAINLSFTYDVVASGSFTEGTGSLASPYIVNTAEQFTHIGEEDGKYYKLGKDINFVEAGVESKPFARINSSGSFGEDDKGSPVGYSMATSLHANSNGKAYTLGNITVAANKCDLNSFVLDGNKHTVTFGGNTEHEELALFGSSYNATVKNLNVEYAPGSKACTVFSWIYGDLVCENITINGTVSYGEGIYNQGLLAYYDYYSKSITAKNVVNNVSLSADKQYNGVFVGYSKNVFKYLEKTYNFVNCKNNGNFSGPAFGMITGHTGSETEFAGTVFKINVVNFENTGRITAPAYGMVGYNVNALGYWNERSFKNDWLKITENNCKGVADSSEQITILSSLVSENGKDVTFVKTAEGVAMSAAAKAAVEANGYTVKSQIYVSCSYEHSAGYEGSSYIRSVMSDNVNVVYPYTEVEQGTNIRADLVLDIENGKIIAPSGTSNGLTVRSVAKSYRLAYFVYDQNGTLVYASTIDYKNVQNA